MSMKSELPRFAMEDGYFTVKAITSEAITEAALTMVEVTESLYALF